MLRILVWGYPQRTSAQTWYEPMWTKRADGGVDFYCILRTSFSGDPYQTRRSQVQELKDEIFTSIFFGSWSWDIKLCKRSTLPFVDNAVLKIGLSAR